MSGIAYLQIFEPDVGHIVQNFMLMLPIYILMSLFWLHKVKKKAGISRNTAAFKIVFNDELRLQTIHRSYREAFFILIAAQIPMAFLFNENTLVSVSVIHSITTVVVGIVSFLALFLLHDR